jgi:antitoxin component YwqK of YwqJK toxin-antitoxin module
MDIEDQEKFLNLIEEVGVKLNKLASGNVYLKEDDDEITQWFKDRGGFNDVEDYISGNANEIIKTNDEKNVESIRKLGFESPMSGKGYMDENGKQGLWSGGNYELTYVDGVKNGLYKEYISGKLYLEVMYKNDKMNGIYRRFNDDGTVDNEYILKDDKVVVTSPT